MSLVGELSDAISAEFHAKQSVMSFADYLALVEKEPAPQLRSAAQYIRDAFLYFGVSEAKRPGLTTTRYRLFDAPWDGRDALVGQEHAQERVFRILDNFVREGAVNKLIMLHGPNGSAKSTLVRCIGRALHHYSAQDAGALYCFGWVFPTEESARAGIGFGSSSDAGEDSFAQLAPELMQAKLFDELRDHPLLLIPVKHRQKHIERWEAAHKVDVPDYLRYGRLSHKNYKIYEALLASYGGDYQRVLRHVQVERFHIDQRYRQADVTVEPQIAVDATERQVTMDRSVQALPSSLQYLSLHEYGGELTNANRGLIEYSDILKRPLEAYKYLLTTVERSSVSLANATLFLDVVFFATTNEVHLHAFKQIAEFQSFRGRLELVRVPYLLDYTLESDLYGIKLQEAAGGRHVAPHCAFVAALWAVLTRIRKPQSELYTEDVRKLIEDLSPMDKARLYATGETPAGLSAKLAKTLTANVEALREESKTYPNYEGRTGASPREMMQVLYDAAGRTDYTFVSPVAVLEQIAELCEKTSVYDFLNQDVVSGFHDHKGFITQTKEAWLDIADREFCAALGFIDENEYDRVFNQYITHVIHWTRKERVRNPATGEYEDPDERMMKDVETTLDVGDDAADFRHNLIAKVGAWSLDHPNAKPKYPEIFPTHYERLREAYYEKQRKPVRDGLESLLALLDDETLAAAEQALAESAFEALQSKFGYEKDSAREVGSLLLARYRNILGNS